MAKGQKGVPSPAASEDLNSEGAGKALPFWTCQIESSPRDGEWTVGEIIPLSCEGPSVAFESSELELAHADPLQKHSLKILEVNRQTENNLQLKVTTYTPGPNEFKATVLLDKGRPVLQVESLIIPTKSVLEKPDQKPYGPISALKLGYPVWLWISLVTVLIGLLFFVLFRLRRKVQMKKVIDELQQHNTALGAFNQFNKDIRQLGRNYIFGEQKAWPEEKKFRYVQSLDEIFRMYLLREFFVPALDWDSSLTLKTLSKQDKKRFFRYGHELKRVMQELDQAKKDSDKLKSQDCKQLTQMTARVSQQIWKARKMKV